MGELGCLPARARRRTGQSLVEFALVGPVFLMILLLTLDFARLVYTYTAIAWATREGARIVSFEAQQDTDCPVLQRIESAGRGFALSADPNSVWGNTDPNSGGSPGPTTPPPGQGFVYIYPAVAVFPPDTNCAGGGQARLQPQTVSVMVQYSYVPLVPWFSAFVPNITIKAISVIRAEY